MCVVVVVVGGWRGVDARAPISSSSVDVRKCDARIDAFLFFGGGRCCAACRARMSSRRLARWLGDLRATSLARARAGCASA